MEEQAKQTEEQTATQEPVQEAPQEPTIESKLQALEAEKVRLSGELESAKKGLSSAHAKLTEKDKILKNVDRSAEIKALESKFDVLAEYIAELNKPDAYGEQKKPVDLTSRFKRIETETQAKNALTQTQQRIYGYEEKTEALGLTENDVVYWKIKDLAVHGKFDEADKVLASFTPTQSQPKTAPTETEDQRIDRLAEEKKRKFLEDNGLLKAEKTAPGSAGSNSRMDAYAKYAEGKISTAEFAKLTQ